MKFCGPNSPTAADNRSRPSCRRWTFRSVELDLGSLPEQEREQEWTRLVREQGRKPFDLSRAPLLRATMVHLSSREHRLLLTTHHILADEWSMEVVHQELKQLYEALFSRAAVPSSRICPSNLRILLAGSGSG